MCIEITVHFQGRVNSLVTHLYKLYKKSHRDYGGNCFCFVLFLFVCLFCFLGPHLWHMEIPRLEVESAPDGRQLAATLDP